MFSAYDLKKIIPRAILALVLVNLSWGLMEIFINGIETIGFGAKDLITEPFGKVQQLQLGAGGAFAFTGLIAGAAGAALIGIIPVFGVAVTGLFGILFAFGIIMIRRVLLIALIIIAPIAISLSVFPQTENYAKKWWDWFSKLLLMYPFIMAFFGVSEVAAGIISQTKGASEFENLIYDLSAVLILIVPYFLVGKALALAGGTIGKVAGMVNNKDKGIIDKTKKWEAGKVAERRYDAARGQRYSGRNFVTRGINTSLRAARHPGSAVGTQASRDTAVLNLVQENADSLESRHERAKTMTSGERAIHALVSDESEAATQINALATQRAKDLGMEGDTATIKQEQDKIKLDYENGKAKMGGSVDAASQLYNLQKATAEGSVAPELAASAAERLAGKLSTGGGQQKRVADSLHQQLDSAAASAGYMPGAVSAAAGASRTVSPGGGGRVPTINHSDIDAVYSGAKARDSKQLADLKPEVIKDITESKVQRSNDSITVIQSTTSTVDEVHAATEELVRHRADLLVTQSAAATAGKQATVDQTREAIDKIDASLTAAEAASAGRLAGLTTHVHTGSGDQAKSRVKPI